MKDRVKVHASKEITPRDGGCIWWRGATNSKGRGQIGLTIKGEKKGILVTRLVLAKVNGRDLSDLGPGEQALHKCDNIPCVNPRHLYFGGAVQNTEDTSRRTYGNETPGITRWMDKETGIETWHVGVQRDGVRRGTNLRTSEFSLQDAIAKKEELLQEILKELEDLSNKAA